LQSRFAEIGALPACSRLDWITTVIEAWENLRPSKSFSGLTLDQFKELIKPMLDARKRITELEKQMHDAYTDRDAADAAALAQAQLVVSSVVGDRENGGRARSTPRWGWHHLGSAIAGSRAAE